jgi:ABC-type phosphate transport system substrate-binding protein
MRKLAAIGGALGLALLFLGTGVPATGATVSHALINGSGSGWSANAVNQWIADVQPKGLQVVYTAVGSAQGRKDFAYKTTDYAVSDIGYQGHDEVTGDVDTSLGRKYAYLPIVAGGTAFPYHIDVAGQLVRTLRLSGQTLAKIFTNKITNWNDPQIRADNNKRFQVGSSVIGSLPSIPIIPVVHSEGAGTTAQFTTFLNTVYPSLWQPFFGHNGFTEYYPRKGAAIAQNGSDGVMNYVSSSSANGAIGFDEYSYALAKNYPVAKVLNQAGFYTLPTQYNVAVALTKAIINENKNSPNYLLQDLHNVYVASDPRTYPLSSYSYGIIPTAPTDQKMTTAKRQTLVDFLSYSICRGQREMGPIGYSPLPLNLVQASFAQVGKLKVADHSVQLASSPVTSCDNPTFYGPNLKINCLAIVAPPPPPCDKKGTGPCAAGAGSANGNPNGCNGHGGGQAPGGSGNGGSGGSQQPNGTGTSAPPGSSNGNGNPSSAPSVGTSLPPGQIDPNTGQFVGGSSGGDTSSGGDLSIGGGAVPVATEIPHQGSLSPGILAPLVVLVLLGLIAGPPLLARRLNKPPDKPQGS